MIRDKKLTLLPPLALLSALLLALMIPIVYATINITISDLFNLVDSLAIKVGIQPFNDLFHLKDSILIRGSSVILSDVFKFMESISIGSVISIITTTITSIITQIAQATCNGGSCFVPTNAPLLDYVMTIIVIPAMFLIITGFSAMYMGIKSFGILILLESFTLMGLAFLGIIPQWFTFLIIIFVSAALAKTVMSFFRGGEID